MSVTWGKKMDSRGQSAIEYAAMLFLIAAMVAGSIRFHSLPTTGGIVVLLLTLFYAWRGWQQWKRNRSAREVAELNEQTQTAVVEQTAAALAASQLLAEIRRSDPALWQAIEQFQVRSALQSFATSPSEGLLTPEEKDMLRRLREERENAVWWQA